MILSLLSPLSFSPSEYSPLVPTQPYVEVQLVVGERRMDGRQEKDDIQVGLEEEIEQEGLAPE